MARNKRNHNKQIKFKAALEVIKGEGTIAQLSEKYGVHNSVLLRWKKELLENGCEIFERKKASSNGAQLAVDDLQRKIGELTMEIDFLKKAYNMQT